MLTYFTNIWTTGNNYGHYVWGHVRACFSGLLMCVTVLGGGLDFFFFCLIPLKKGCFIIYAYRMDGQPTIGCHNGACRIVGNFWGVQFSQEGNLRRFHGLIFVKDIPEMLLPQLLVDSASHRMHACGLELAKRLVKDRSTCTTEGEMARKSHMIKAMVRGYRVYKEIWYATVGEELSCVREVENYRNPFAVAVVKQGVVVGHVPRKISLVYLMLLRRGGTIDCRVTWGRCYSEDLLQGGLEIPCTLTLIGSHSGIDKVKKLLKRAFSSKDCAEKKNKPPRKKPKRSLPDEFNKINSGEKLSNLSIDFAQELLKQFPGVNGLQSTLFQYKLKASVPPKDQLQVIHSCDVHWIIASTVGCMGDEVCDSVYSTLDRAILDVIANFPFFYGEDAWLPKAGGRKRLWIICHCLCHHNWTWSRPIKYKAKTSSNAKSPDYVLWRREPFLISVYIALI